MRIFESTYGRITRRSYKERTVNEAKDQDKARERASARLKKPKESFLLVDGYNLIFATPSFRILANNDISHARDVLVRMLCDYSAFHGIKVIAVFDAYSVKRGMGSVERCGSVTVVYTKEAETADSYIEKVTYDTARDNHVRVVTGDMTEQLVILGNGALRVSPKEFMDELEQTSLSIREALESK